jgi:hypothetical protein
MKCVWCQIDIPSSAQLVYDFRGIKIFVTGHGMSAEAHQFGVRRKRKLTAEEETRNWRRLEEVEVSEGDVMEIAA